MPIKLTIEEIREIVEEKGYTLLSKVYTNALSDLEILCPRHGHQTVTAKWLRRGSGCYECGQEIKGSKLRLSIEHVRGVVEKAGYSLISTVYERGKGSIDLSCPTHGPFIGTYGDILGGHGCPGCGYEIGRNKRRTSIDEIKNIVAKTNYELLSTSYEKHDQKINLRCKKHGDFSKKLSSLNMGQGCRSCGHERRGVASRTSHEVFLERIAHFGYSVITKYNGANKKIRMGCPKHGEFDTRPGSLMRGIGCSWCSRSSSTPEFELFDAIRSVYPEVQKTTSRVSDPTRPYIKRFELDIHVPRLDKGVEFDGTHWHSFETLREGKAHWPEEDVRNYHEIKDAHFLSKGISILHIKEKDWNKDKAACVSECLSFFALGAKPIKYGNVATPQSESLLVWINKLCPSSVIDYQENKIELSDVPIRIKINNLVSMQPNDIKNDKYQSSGDGVRLISVMDSEWTLKRPQIEGYIMSVLGKTPISLMARKTVLKEVIPKTAAAFLKQNHIQGSCRIEMAYGLFHDGELVGIMTGSKHHRQGNKDGIFVLNRMAFKTGISVAGGASKLLKALVSYAKNNGYSKIISWSDNRWSDGNVYKKIGFVLEKDMPPDYFYTDGAIIKSKQSCQKTDLIAMGAVGTMENTEKELALSLGFRRIFDCGKKRWALKL